MLLGGLSGQVGVESVTHVHMCLQVADVDLLTTTDGCKGP